MKKTFTALKAPALLVLCVLVGFGGVASALEGPRMGSGNLCERFNSVSRLFPTCSSSEAPPPPPPADACLSVPGDQASGPCANVTCVEQGGTWSGTSCDMPATPPTPPSDHERVGRNFCERYASSSPEIPLPPSCIVPLPPPPPPVDTCPNVPGDQIEGPCADLVCAGDGGAWDGTSCDFPAFVNITYPNGGETFNEGDVIEITWESHKADSCRLGYSTGPGTLDWILGADIPGEERSALWTVKTWGESSVPQQLKIYIICWAGAFEDYSDDFFTVVPLPPADVCPNVSGDQASGPCADAQCVEDGGTWNEPSCDFPPPAPLACSDTVDNDGDGDIDFPADTGCSSEDDDTETFSGGAGGGGGGGGGSSGAGV